MIVQQEFFVSCLIFIHAHAENYAAFSCDILLQAIKRLGFFEARRAPRGPKIQDYNFAAQIGQARRACDLNGKILGFASGKAGFALTIAGRCEHIQHGGHKDQGNRTQNFVLHG